MKCKLIVYLILIFCFVHWRILSLPGLNLGFSNILDGGPIRPTPGIYWLGYFQYYHSNNFMDGRGNPVSPTPISYDSSCLVNNFAYQFKLESVPGVQFGIDGTLSATLLSNVQKNHLNIKSSGSGIGDLHFGTYVQWDPIMYKERALFVHRFEFSIGFPTGKNRLPNEIINPGSRVYSFNPYWAATFYFTPDFAASWRIYYLWTTKNNKIDLKEGDAVHLNYSIEYQIIPSLWIAINGYFLRQIQDDIFKGVVIPDSKDQIFAIGPGFLYSYSEDLVFFGHLYFESMARLRPQGISAIVRFVKHF